ncbi:Dihydropteroate synthase [Thermosyntropha lipolytica DSM 11003]|uniref:Dihydropteroate synthase n=1 Tax=Thermosyntropha lipolytica DSM 11003 TaxID=1123382 RepID=A0A1M5JU17_9FIRM|nr:Dihydropteroate synthase [Thermosyntropha lipolytica DSM 11003]
MQGHRAVLIKDREEARRFMEEIGVDQAGYAYMEPKAVFRCIKLKDIPCRAANIIKQEMLSKGGEAAVKRDALSSVGHTDVLLMGTLKHYRLLIKKLKVQPFGLKQLAGEIEAILEGVDKKSFTIELHGGKTLELGNRTLIMGILNVTPDSFSDGGRYSDPARAVERALEMKEEGADIIDIGGASSRPNATIASEEEEMERVLPVLKELVKEDLIISVDTFRGRVAKACLDLGAHIINDIGRFQMDPTLLPVLAEYNAPAIIMHNRMQMKSGEPYEDLISDIIVELKESIKQAEDMGLKKEKLIIDPGIGFGKTVEQNRLIVKRLWEFKSLGRPILLGASRKSFIGHTLNLEVGERLEGSLAVAAIGIMNGADILRVHDVKETKRVAMMTDAVVRENG